MLKLDELITILQQGRKKYGDIEVCKVGHYGEIHEIESFDIRFEKAREGAFGDGKGRIVVNLDTPDTGPEPD